MRRFSVLLVSVASVAGLLALFTLFPGTAFASSYGAGPHHSKEIHLNYDNCGGTCNNKDPYTTGCGAISNGAYLANALSVFDNSGTKLVMVQNWYAPKCGTNWNVTYIYGSIATKISIFRTNKLPVYCYPEDCSSFYTGTGSPMWTNMAFAPNIQAYADTTAQSPNDHLYYSVSIGA